MWFLYRHHRWYVLLLLFEREKILCGKHYHRSALLQPRIDEIHLNLALASQCAGEDKGKITESIGNRLRLATEVSLNDIHLISLERILELLGMETQLKEKRIVDLRSGGGKANEESVKG